MVVAVERHQPAYLVDPQTSFSDVRIEVSSWSTIGQANHGLVVSLSTLSTLVSSLPVVYPEAMGLYNCGWSVALAFREPLTLIDG